jgi:hypothetical protein
MESPEYKVPVIAEECVAFLFVSIFCFKKTFVFPFLIFSRSSHRIEMFDGCRLCISQVRPRLAVNFGASEVSDWAIQHVIV